MADKRISDQGSGRSTETEPRGFHRRPPGSPPPDPGHLQQPRQSGDGDKPPRGQEKGRPRDTDRSGA
jgi:hypothetical protein